MDLGRFRYYTAWHHVANRRRYDAPADPWKLLRVTPGGVEYYTSEVALNWGLGRVEGGDWDREANLKRLDETVVYRGLVQRFEADRNWEETALYERAAEAFAERGSFRGYDSLAAFRDVRCAYLDDLYRSIAEDGYRPNEAAGHEKPAEDNAFEGAYANHLEPLVVVGREGGIYWAEGYHRLVLAAILGVEAIPVYALCRHVRWQRVRDRVADASGGDLAADGLPDGADLDHLDLRDVRA